MGQIYVSTKMYTTRKTRESDAHEMIHNLVPTHRQHLCT